MIVRRQQPIDELEDSLRRIHFNTADDERKQIRDAGGKQENERQRREDQVEGDPAGEEQHIVFATVVPDAFDVVTEGPAKVDKERTLGCGW